MCKYLVTLAGLSRRSSAASWRGEASMYPLGLVCSVLVKLGWMVTWSPHYTGSHRIQFYLGDVVVLDRRRLDLVFMVMISQSYLHILLKGCGHKVSLYLYLDVYLREGI